MIARRPGIRARLAAEMKTMLFVFVDLAALLGALTLYRRLILSAYQISYIHYGYNFVEAFVLAKIIVFGRTIGLGERFRDRPLIVPTAYNTVYFAALVLVFSVLERHISGWIQERTTRDIWDAILGQGVWEILSRVLVIVLVFLPLFAVWETARALGGNKLFELFFQRRLGQQPGDPTGSASANTVPYTSASPLGNSGVADREEPQ